ncbi:MAG: LysM peptidoglycan-binding domain-containing protein [Candidatus Anstonellales archaeon]
MKSSELASLSKFDIVGKGKKNIDEPFQKYDYKKLIELIKSSRSWEDFLVKAGSYWASYMENESYNLKGIIKDFYLLMPYLKVAFEKGFREQARKQGVSDSTIDEVLKIAAYGFNVLDLVFIFIPESDGRKFSVSSRGAAGLFQFLPETWDDFARAGFKDPKYRFDPIIGAEAAGAYFSYLLSRFGTDPLLATVVYNGGEGRIEGAKVYKDFFANYILKKAKGGCKTSSFIENTYYPPKFLGTIMALSDENFFKKNSMHAYSDFFSRQPADFSIITIKRQHRTYRVKKGDNFYSIARKHNVDMDDLMALNGFSKYSSRKLKEGDVLIIPQYFDFKKDAYNELEKEAKRRGLDLAYLISLNSHQIEAASKTGVLNLIIPSKKLTEQKMPKHSVKDPIIPKKDKEITPQRDNTGVIGKGFVHYDASQDTTYISHRVKRGHTLYSIALNYGVSINDILRWNNKKLTQIEEGEMLIIKLKGRWEEAGVVRPGDSFYELKGKIDGDIFIFGSSANAIKPGEKIYKRVS